MKKLLFLTLFCGILGSMATSCDKNETPKPTLKVEIPTAYRAFILNAGSFKGNNSNLTYFDPQGVAAPIDNLFYKQNEKNIGDTGESMLYANGSIYIAVYGSNVLYKLSKDGVLQHSRTIYKPRQMAVLNGHLYVSKYAGQVTKLDANTLDSITSINIGHNLEGIAELNGKLYVCDSHDGVDNKIKYEDVYIINPTSMKSEGSIKVVINPTDLKAASNGKLYCLSQGDYGEIGYSVQEVDVTTKTSKHLAVATHMTLGKDVLYMINSATDWSQYPKIIVQNTYLSYNLKSGTVNNTSYLKTSSVEGFDNTSIFSMFVDRNSDMFYISTSDFKTNGDLYRFDKSGNFLSKFDTGGINPKDIVFIK